MSTNVYVIEEGTTNLVLNPQVAYNTLNTNNYLAVSTRVTDRPEIGKTALKTVTDGTHASNNGPRISSSVVNRIGAEIAVTGSATVFGTPGDPIYFGVQINYSDGADYPNTLYIIPESGIMRVTHTSVINPARHTRSYTLTITGGRAESLVYWSGDYQIEEKPHATSFTHGDMGEGYSWTGTPHASASIREPSSISIPTPEPESLYIRYSEDGEIWHNQYKSFIDEPEDIEPTLLLSPDGTYDRDGEVTPSITGGVIEVDGEYGKAWQIAEGTTNLITNPSFEVGALPWSQTGGTGEISTDRSYAGDKSYRYQVTTGATQRFMTGWSNTISVAASETYTLSAWIFNATGSVRTPRLLVEFPDQSGYLKESTAAPVLPGQWQRLVFTFTTYATTTRVAPQVHFSRVGSGTVSGDIWYIDAIQLEEKPYATPYADGSLGAGHAWTGTPHNSASIREPARISAPASEPSSAYIKYETNSGEEKENYFDVAAEREGEFTRASLLLRPEGSYSWAPEDGVQEVTPTLSGGAIVVDGEHGNAWQVAEATTNLVLNPALKSGTLRWAKVGTNTTLDVASEGVITENSLRSIRNDVGGTVGPYTNMILQPNTIYTASVYIKGTAGVTHSISLVATNESAQQTRVANESVTLSGGWQRVVLTGIPTPADTIRGFVSFYEQTANVGHTILVNALQVEAKPYATPYADGSLGAGHAWTDTPHDSASTRAAGSISIPTTTKASEFTLFFRTKLLGGTPTARQPLVRTNAGDADWPQYPSIYRYPNGQVRLSVQNLGHGGRYTPEPVSVGVTNIYAMRWDGESGRLFFNGESLGDDTTLNVGARDIAVNIAGTNAAESLLIYPNALTDAEVQRIATMNKAWTMENTTVYPAKVDLEGATAMWGNDEIVIRPDRSSSIASIVQYDKPLSDSDINYLSRSEIHWGNVTVPKVRMVLNDHSDLKRAENKITITTKKKLYIGAVVGFSRPLSQKEIDILDSTPLEYISDKTLLNLPDTTIGVSRML